MFGQAVVTVPDSMNVNVECEAALGTCPTDTRFGPGAGTDAPVLTVVGDLALGELKVEPQR